MPAPKAPKPPKSEKPSDIWTRFKLETVNLAKTLNVPQAWTLEKVREKGKKRGDAWKDFERAYTKLLVEAGFTKAERISRGDDLGESDVDILVPENPLLKVDTKYKVDGWSVRTLFDEVEAKYVREGSGEFLIMPLKSGGTEGSVTVIRSEKLASILAENCLRDAGQSHPFSCPVCPGFVQARKASLGLASCSCTSCGLEFQTAASNVPQVAWIIDIILPADHAARLAAAAAKPSKKGRNAA